jgi:hypothetical protein
MRRPLLIALVAAAVAAVVAVVVGVSLAHAAARGDALATFQEASAELRDVVSTTEDALGEAGEVLALGTDPLAPTAELEVLAARHAAAGELAADARGRLSAETGPLDTDGIRALSDDLRALGRSLDDTGLADALDAVLDAAATGAATIETSNFDANNAPRIAFRAATAALADPEPTQVGEALAAYLDAAHALEASHAAELAEKAGPLFEARLAVQDFARSLSGGVLLEFDWAPVVNGYGTGGSYGGTSYWTTADGGQATITLTDSVAAQWPGDGVQALVVHEVGHAILARRDCNELFFESDLYPGEEESWATAWAIGLGYTADGSGESVYGRPSDALIALSAACR